MSKLPSTQALRALEAFSRHGTVWEAADELNVTRSAVSHQLRQLERDLGFALFTRVGTGIELTVQGRAYAGDVRRALLDIADAATRNAGNGLSGTLTISCTPGFASAWLAVKIRRFHATCPDVELRIVTPKRLDGVSNPDADIFITFSSGNAAGVENELLKEVEFSPLISPALLNRMGGLQEPADVLRGDILHLADQQDWYRWLRAAGVDDHFARQGIVFADMNLIYAAALNAQGIAMGDEFICHEAMASGQLVRPFDLVIKSPNSYYLATPPAKANLETVQAFREWILSELRQSIHR